MSTLSPDQALEILKKDPMKVINMLGKEIARLKKLLDDNGINYHSKVGPGAAISVKASVKVFDSKEDALNAQNNIS